jgi:hypothetical protein
MSGMPECPKCPECRKPVKSLKNLTEKGIVTSFKPSTPRAAPRSMKNVDSSEERRRGGGREVDIPLVLRARI